MNDDDDGDDDGDDDDDADTGGDYHSAEMLDDRIDHGSLSFRSSSLPGGFMGRPSSMGILWGYNYGYICICICICICIYIYKYVANDHSGRWFDKFQQMFHGRMIPIHLSGWSQKIRESVGFSGVRCCSVRSSTCCGKCWAPRKCSAAMWKKRKALPLA